MIYVKINEQLYPATVDGTTKDIRWDNRHSKSITLEMTYEEAVNTFVDDLAWSIYQTYEPYVDEQGETVTPTPDEWDNSEYCVAGSITDHRNGYVTVKMGKPTEVETLQKQLANAVTEEELETAYTEGVNSL